jgi:putative Mg2+ transporter-C (MgtC) family protein
VLLPTTTDLLITFQIVLAGALAGVIGWQRHYVGRPAGLRTHALVAMASAAFTVAGVYGFGPTAGRDVTRIAAQVVTGIGFLGAGTIFRSRNRVTGLTTAATLWFAAGLGVLVGAGLVWVAIFGTAIALLVLTVVRRIERPNEPE